MRRKCTGSTHALGSVVLVQLNENLKPIAEKLHARLADSM